MPRRRRRRRDCFAGVLTLGFTADYETPRPFCKGEGVHFVRRPDGNGLTLSPDPKLALRWVDVHGASDSVCPAAAAAAFIGDIDMPTFRSSPASSTASPTRAVVAAAARGAGPGNGQVAHRAADRALSLRDLPLVEVPAAGAGNDDVFAVLLSGDGGWAGLDKEVARAVSERGIPVVGWDTLRYFWSARTPEALAHDLARTLDYYAAAWQRHRVLLIGYSQGADVLPFAVNRLPAVVRSRILTTTLLGLGRKAAFEFHLANWVGPAAGLSILPEYQKLPRATTLCVFGAGDKDSLCSDFPPGTAGTLELAGGHHFDGDYDALARLVLKFAGRNP